MTRKLSLAHLTAIQASPPQLVNIAADAGYDCVGLRLLEVTPGDAWPIIADSALLAETKRILADRDIQVLDVELVRLTPEVEIESFKPMLATAAELGARHVLTQGHDPERSRLVENFAAFCSLAREYGLTADVEFLTWTGLNCTAHAWSLIQEAGCDEAGVMIDTLHFCRSGCDPNELKTIPPERFHFVQISDAAGPRPDTTEGLIFTAREDRLFPGEGDLDLFEIMLALPPDISVGIEIPNSRLAQALEPADRASRARLATLELLRRVDDARSAAHAR